MNSYNIEEHCHDLRSTYQQHWWCRRHHYFRLKKEQLVMNMISLFLVTCGVIIGPLLTNAIVVALCSVAAVMLKGFIEHKRYPTLIDMNRFAYTTYVKDLQELKLVKDGAELEKWIYKTNLTHAIIIDLAPAVPDYIKRKYRNIDKIDGNLTVWVKEEEEEKEDMV